MTKEEFKLLFDNYFDSVRSYLVYRGAEKEQASDLAQDVFLRVWEKQMDIDIKTALRLLYKMARDMFISQYRRETLEMNYKASLDIDYRLIFLRKITCGIKSCFQIIQLPWLR